MAKATPKSRKKTSKPAQISVLKYIKWFWITFATGALLLILLFLLASWGAFGEMPTFEELENPQNDLATQIISSDGVQIGTFFKENRTPVNYEDLPQHLVDALVATEDARYYDHSGIDARGTLRAFVFLGKKGGASTITQQLAKLLFHGERAKGWQKYTQKIKEWVISVRLERQYTKDEIIAMYLNKQGFLFQATGVSSASRIYFNKSVNDLKIEEAAVLVAMLKNPRQFNPHREISKKKSLNRRNVVFSQMEKYGYINSKQRDSLQQLPMVLDFSPEGHSDGIATYFREFVRSWMQNWVKNNPKGENEEGNTEYYDIYRDGLKINVTIDSRMQRYAEEAVQEHMANLQKEFDKQELKNKTSPFRDLTKQQVEGIIKRSIRTSARRKAMLKEGKSEKEILASFNEKTEMKIFSWKGTIDTIMTPRDSILYYKRFLRSGMMSMEPQTGQVKAWVGGVDIKHFQYDQVYQGTRQVGSTFKPFVYATAIDQLKLSPCDTIPRSQITIAAGTHGVTEDWTPKNSDGKYEGYMSLKSALAQSVNTISARLMDRIGPEPIVRLAKRAGVTSDIVEVASISLGSVDLKLSEMVGAYSTFANKGIYTKPVMITSIQDKNGTVLYQFVPETRDVISKEAAYVTINLMEGVTQSGSGVRLRTGPSNRYDIKNVVTGHPYLFDNPIAGKTGTTQNQSDGWFMGIVPNLCTGVWVGGEERSVHFSTTTFGQGAAMALPIWGLYMKKCYADKTLKVSKEAFEKPEGLTIEVDCKKFKEAIIKDENPEDEFGF
ncbi:penicillin-binding protein 1A [Aquimarina sp. 2201CG5-10]|uniref:penicillin-binding protein 1A n=1 Tax=Aquimarina callyspongiae TaxID=3098150 RepID=UPI002AB3E561|nr:transglycosylase domain-containing protein [Aquimarina sp. 2201CG5-10]MDY8137166.1 transglycosylase domain-containing protein [Aquimarina sp. 2201CG5-10]